MLTKSQNSHLQINSFLPFHGPVKMLVRTLIRWPGKYSQTLRLMLIGNKIKLTKKKKKRKLTILFICIYTFSS